MAKLNWKTPNGNSGNVDLDKIFTTDGGTINGDTTVQSSTAELDIKNSSRKKGSTSANFGKLKILDSDGKMVALLEAYPVAAGMRFALRLYPNIDGDETNPASFFVQNAFGIEDGYSALFGIEPPLDVNNSTIPTTSWVRKILSSLDIPTITVSNDSELDNLNRNVFFEGTTDSRFPNTDFNGISIVTKYQAVQILFNAVGSMFYRVNDDIPFSPNNWSDFTKVANNISVVHLTGDEVISGIKRFNNRTKFASSVDFIENEVEHGRIYNISNRLRFVSGIDSEGGAYLDLVRLNSDTDSSYFRIVAKTSSTEKELIGHSDGRLVWAGNNVALAKDFLPLSGGTVTGNTTFTRDVLFSNDNSGGAIFKSSNYIRIIGGTSIGKNANRSAYINLTDLNHSNSGQWELCAANASTLKTLVGKPDGTLTWDGKNVAWDVKTGSTNGTISVNGSDVSVKGLGSRAYDSTSYLPLSGGIMTGMLNMNGTSINMGSSYTDPKGRLYFQDNRLRITGGASTSDGSWLDLYQSKDGSGFTLNARNSSGTTTLQGKQDGTLLWGGRHIVRSMGVQGGSEGYQTFSTNIAIEWGTANFNGAKYVDVTLPLSLVGVYGAYGVDAVSESSTGLQSSNGAIAWAYGNNTTSSGLVTKIRFVSDVTNIAVFKYFVIGRI